MRGIATELSGLELDNMFTAVFLLGAAFGICMISFLESIIIIRKTQVTLQSVSRGVFYFITAVVALTLALQLL